jgi:hypothetical protein
VSVARERFGPTLKAERLRRGLTLHGIAESTKIGVPLLEGLERNDVSRWPEGIYRRAFVRAYVDAIGLPHEPIVADFVRLFPDASGMAAQSTDGLDPGATRSGEPGGLPLRLTLAASSAPPLRAPLNRALPVAVEVVAILLLGAALAAWTDGSLITAAGAVALVYFPLMNLGAGHSFGTWWDPDRRRLRPRPRVVKDRWAAPPPLIVEVRHAIRPAFTALWVYIKTLPEQLARSLWRYIWHREA